MITHMELKLRDRNDAAILIRVIHDSEKPTDWTALDYTAIGVGVMVESKIPGDIASAVARKTDFYTEARIMQCCLDMADNLLDLSCPDKVDGKREHPSAGPRVLNRL